METRKLNELQVTDEISKLIPESLTDEEKILRLEEKEKRAAVIAWMTKDPEVNIIIAFSGGKDSIYMVLYCLFVLNIPAERIELWHHDVDGHGEELFDWKVTPDYCRAFAKAFGLKLLFSYRHGGIVKRLLRLHEPLESIYYQSEPDGPFYEIKSDPTRINDAGRWPSVNSDLQTRWCSPSVKIEVASAVFTNDPRFKGTKEKPTKTVFLTGERHDESTARLMLKEVEVYRSSEQKFVSYRHVILWRPNVEVTERMVWDMMEKHKVQAHPCYMIGWSRCSCQLCIFNQTPYWKTIMEISPEKITRMRELEVITASYPKNEGREHTLYDGMTIIEKATKPAPLSKELKAELKSLHAALIYLSSEEDKATIQARITEIEVMKTLPAEPVIDVNDPENAYWIKQATEKFDHPIIIDNWKLPKGAMSKIKCGAT